MSQMDYKPLTLNPRWSKYYHCPLQTSPYHETNTVKPNQKCKQHTFLLRLKQLQLETFFPLYDFFSLFNGPDHVFIRSPLIL